MLHKIKSEQNTSEISDDIQELNKSQFNSRYKEVIEAQKADEQIEIKQTKIHESDDFIVDEDDVIENNIEFDENYRLEGSSHKGTFT